MDSFFSGQPRETRAASERQSIRHLDRVLFCSSPTSVDDLSSHGQHHLTVAGGVGHQIQHLLVRTAFDHHAVDADELVSCPQATVFLRRAAGHDGPDVHLGKDVLTEG